MATKGKTEKELWQALEGLDADLLDPGLPESAVDDELKALGVDPLALAKRASEFVAVVKEEERLSWQERAHQISSTIPLEDLIEYGKQIDACEHAFRVGDEPARVEASKKAQAAFVRISSACERHWRAWER